MGQEALGATGRILDLEAFPGFEKALPGRATLPGRLCTPKGRWKPGWEGWNFLASLCTGKSCRAVQVPQSSTPGPAPLPFRGCPAPTGRSVRAVATGPVLPLDDLEQGISPEPHLPHLHNGHQCQLPHRPVLGFHELTDVAGFTKGIVSHR